MDGAGAGGDARSDAGERGDAAVVVDDGGLASDAATADARCVLDAGQCVGHPGCCGAVHALRIDLDRMCLAGPSVPMACTPTPVRVGDACGYAATQSCVARRTDAGLEAWYFGGIIPPHYVPDGEECPEPLRARVGGLEIRPCK